MDNEIRPDRQIHISKHDPELTAKLSAVKKEPLDHIVTLDRHTGDITVSSFADTFQARNYEKSLPPNLVHFEDEGNPQADDALVRGFVHHVAASLQPYDPAPQLQNTLQQIGKLRQDLNEVGNMNLSRFVQDRLQEVENDARLLLEANPALTNEQELVKLRQSLWAISQLGKVMVIKETFGVGPAQGYPEGPHWPSGQPTPTWNAELPKVLDTMRQQTLQPRDRQVGMGLCELSHNFNAILARLAQN